MNRVLIIATTAVMLTLPLSAMAQDDDELFDEDPEAAAEPEPEPEPPAAPEPEPEPEAPEPAPPGISAPSVSKVEAPTTPDDYPAPDRKSGRPEGEEISGFELGINLAGSRNVYINRDGAVSNGWTWEASNNSKVAVEPGWNFGRFGIFLLLGLDYSNHKEEVVTKDTELSDPAHANPADGAAWRDGWYERANVDLDVFTFDIGLGARIYLIEALRELSPNLYMEFDIGWRGAAVKSDFSWDYGGSTSSPPLDGNSIPSDYKDEFETQWNKAADDYAKASAKRYDGLWMNLGIGGEYVFIGGFGIAGEVGLNIFYNNEWLDKSPYGHDNDDSAPGAAEWGRIDWRYYNAKWTGTAFELGLYYSLALRYHF